MPNEQEPQMPETIEVSDSAAKNIFSDNPTPAPAATNGDLSVIQNQPAVAAKTEVVTNVDTPSAAKSTDIKPVDYNTYLKTEFGFDSPEVAKEQIEKWKKLEAEPAKIPEPEKIKFANEESERLFNLIKEGKTKEAAKIYQQQEQIENADKLSPIEQIKLQLKYKNEKYTNDDINDIIEEKYTFPKKPVKRDDELDDEFQERVDKYNTEAGKIERRIKRDGLDAVEQLQQYKKDLVLPDINNQAAQYQQFLKQQKDLEDQENQLRESYKATLDKDYSNFKGLTSTYKDKDVEIQSEFKPTEKQIKELKSKFEQGFDADDYFAKRWFQMKDDKVVGFNIAQQMEDVYLLEHKQEIIDKLSSDIATKRFDEFLKTEKRINFGVTPIDTSKNAQQTLDATLTDALWKKKTG